MEEMANSWLVQRLCTPIVINGENKGSNPFSFGGGLRHGGLTESAMSLLIDVFDFDYMGAAEYEFGAVPKALCVLFDTRKDLTSGNIEVKCSLEEWKNKKREIIKKMATVFYLCKKEHEEEVKKRILLFAADKYRTKEWVGLNSSICRPNDRVKGWLELNNGYFFFIDKQMFEKTCRLFGLGLSS